MAGDMAQKRTERVSCGLAWSDRYSIYSFVTKVLAFVEKRRYGAARRQADAAAHTHAYTHWHTHFHSRIHLRAHAHTPWESPRRRRSPW